MCTPSYYNIFMYVRTYVYICVRVRYARMCVSAPCTLRSPCTYGGGYCVRTLNIQHARVHVYDIIIAREVRLNYNVRAGGLNTP